MRSRPTVTTRPRTSRPTILGTLAAAGLAALVAGAAHAQAGSDDCAAPTPIQGGGLYDFDLAAATTSGQGYLGDCMVDGTSFAANDVWYCWTADCTGIVTLSTCGYTQADTVIAVYPVDLGCQCPGDLPPYCCNDDSCGKQSEVTCEVVCGRRYLIQVGTKPGGFAGQGQLKIDCQGEPCDNGGGGGGDPTAPECRDCCGERPPLVDALPIPFAPGQVAAACQFEDFAAGFAVVLVDIGDQSAAPIGGPPIANWNTQRYSHPDWTVANLGAVFGIAFDGAGNIFTAHTTVYPDWYANPDPVGIGGEGAIYRLDGSTGAVSVLVNLPQQPDPSLNPNRPYPGLGNLDFDCGRDLVVASNFEDGRIYTVGATSGTVHAFDHATGAVAGPMAGTGNQLAETGDPAGAVPLGERVWAVKVAGDRIYYSVWSQDSGNSPCAGANAIHSVAINPDGSFVVGSGRLEVVMPPLSNYSNPVADISFDDECCMLVAERTMSSLSQSGAHQSRTMRLCFDATAGAWGAPLRYDTGTYTGANNSTGGVDFVLGANGPQVWSMADAIQLSQQPVIYGLTSAPVAGGGSVDGPNVDLDGDLAQQQKYQLGSIDITCWGATSSPCEFKTEDIDCIPTADGGFDFEWTVTVTNNSAHDANILILGDPAFAPNNVILLNPPLASGSSTTLDLVISGQSPNSVFCFTATLAASFKDECCTEEICIELPDCSCFDADVATQDLPGNGAFQFGLSLTNLEPYTAEWLSVAVAPGYAATVTPSLVDIAPGLPFGASANLGPVQVATALPPGSQIVVIVGIHSQAFHPCCFEEIVLTVPAQAGVSTPGDVNGDAKVDAQDIAMLLGSWGDGGPTDLNDDGTTDAQDLAIVLANWG